MSCSQPFFMGIICILWPRTTFFFIYFLMEDGPFWLICFSFFLIYMVKIYLSFYPLQHHQFLLRSMWYWRFENNLLKNSSSWGSWKKLMMRWKFNLCSCMIIQCKCQRSKKSKGLTRTHLIQITITFQSFQSFLKNLNEPFFCQRPVGVEGKVGRAKGKVVTGWEKISITE